MSLNILPVFLDIFSGVIIESFFGCGTFDKKIEGINVSHFINDLNEEIITQTFDPMTIIFGPRFLESGIRKKDREISKKIKIMRKFAEETTKKRLKEVQ